MLWSEAPDKGGLLSELWIEANFPAAQSPWTLNRLTQAGRFNFQLCRQLNRTGGIPQHRPLYKHQHEALERAIDSGSGGEKPAIVVTAGTGSGKTEAFLLPILNELFARDRGDGVGTQCIILYPMNALVNDQVDRLYKWLEGQDRIRLFNFTSETLEDIKAANRAGIPKWDSCRVRTRQEARESPVPDIVITNYSMLEYMLCRPQDSVFFGPALRAVVLDEAHLYTGTLAAEITLLLRRLFLRCGVKPEQVLQMATSATLGTGDADELRDFAATIFSKKAQLVHIIEGESTRVKLDEPQSPEEKPSPASVAGKTWIDRSLVEINDKGEAYLRDDPEFCARLADMLKIWVSPRRIKSIDRGETRPAVWLWEALSASPLVHRLEEFLWERGRMPLNELAERLWGSHDADAKRATGTLLQLTSSARREVDDYPLVPHRIHLMARANDGLSSCLDSQCIGPQDLKLKGLGTVHTGFSDQCPECGGVVLPLYRCTKLWRVGFSRRADRRHFTACSTNPSSDAYFLYSLCQSRFRFTSFCCQFTEWFLFRSGHVRGRII